MKSNSWSLGQILNRVQSTFIGLLRVWSIPIVLMLGLASGYTTYYGMSYFITSWIALIITIAVQSIIVICSLEIASIHWKANRTRFVLVVFSLLLSVSVSVSFSYFKFYEISEKENIQLRRLDGVKNSMQQYVDEIMSVKAELLGAQQKKVDKAEKEAKMAFLGTHPEISEKYRNQVGHGPFFRQYNSLKETEVAKLNELNQRFGDLAKDLTAIRVALNSIGGQAEISREDYQILVSAYSAVQSGFENIVTDFGQSSPVAPVLLPYAKFTQGFNPSFAMWAAFSWFAFACAIMVDLFTIILSYRLEFTAPGPLSEDEQDLAYKCLREFSELRINHNDELEMMIEKSELERARRYSDWNRSFGAAYLLNRGYLRKVDDKTVEFAPNLYPIIADRLGGGDNGRSINSKRRTPVPVDPQQAEQQTAAVINDTIKQLYHERR